MGAAFNAPRPSVDRPRDAPADFLLGGAVALLLCFLQDARFVGLEEENRAETRVREVHLCTARTHARLKGHHVHAVTRGCVIVIFWQPINQPVDESTKRLLVDLPLYLWLGAATWYLHWHAEGIKK